MGRPCGWVTRGSGCLHGLRAALGSSSGRDLCFFIHLNLVYPCFCCKLQRDCLVGSGKVRVDTGLMHESCTTGPRVNSRVLTLLDVNALHCGQPSSDDKISAGQCIFFYWHSKFKCGIKTPPRHCGEDAEVKPRHPRGGGVGGGACK